MLRKNNGSILIMTVFVFLMVNIIAITSAGLVLINSKYSKYNYEEIYLNEQCLSQIELVYSNVLREVETALNESKDFESFESYFLEYDFVDKIEENLNQSQCEVVKLDGRYSDENSIYYQISSKSTHDKFNKTISACIKIENPFLRDNYDGENNDIKSGDLVKIFDYKGV